MKGPCDVKTYCGPKVASDVMTGISRVLGLEKPITDLSLNLSARGAQTATVTIVLTHEEGLALARLLGTDTSEPDPI
jgi:hypothetical protein